MRPKRVTHLREVITESSNFNYLRFYHFRVLAMEMCQEFYAASTKMERDIALTYMDRYNKKANWYKNRIEVNGPIVFN